MTAEVLRVERLPAPASDAAAAFHATWLRQAREMLDSSGADGDLVIVMARANFEHDGWRRAAVQSLAREAAPRRVNLVGGDDPRAIEATIAYLSAAPGVTGQYLPLDPAEPAA